MICIFVKIHRAKKLRHVEARVERVELLVEEQERMQPGKQLLLLERVDFQGCLAALQVLKVNPKKTCYRHHHLSGLQATRPS
jgi:hypothetical protein